MKNKIGIICMVLGLLCLSASSGLLIYNHQENTEAGTAAHNVLRDMQEVVPTVHQEVVTLPSLDETEDDEEVSSEMTVTEIDGYGYIGYISLPSIGIELPVMDDWDYTRLKIAPCRQFGSTKSNDLVIAAHNYQKHFGKLSQLQYGDLVSFTDMDGVITFYTVADIETLEPTQVDEVEHSVWNLTLYTCTYGGTNRIVVRCTSVDVGNLENYMQQF